jgi:hypothetical protein
MKIFKDPYLSYTRWVGFRQKTISHYCPFQTGEATQREERLERGRRGSRYGYVS